MFKHLLEALLCCILVRKLPRVLREETQVVGTEQGHHDRLFVNHTLLLALLPLLLLLDDLALVAVEALLQTVESLVQVVHRGEKLLRSLLNDELGCHTVLFADFYCLD